LAAPKVSNIFLLWSYTSLYYVVRSSLENFCILLATSVIIIDIKIAAIIDKMPWEHVVQDRIKYDMAPELHPNTRDILNVVVESITHSA
jgi:hypothetical protein